MTLLVELLADGEITGSPLLPTLDADGELSLSGHDYDRMPEADVTLDVVPGILPAAAGEQLVGSFIVRVDGVALRPDQLSGPVSVTESEDGARTFGFAVPRRKDGDYLDPLGVPADFLGPPPGKGSIDVDAVHLGDSGPVAVRLITDGMVENAPGQLGAQGDLRAFNGIGPEGRYDQVLVDLVIPPGHGLSQGQMVERILAEMGLEAGLAGLDDDPRYNEITATKIPGLGVIQEFLKTFGKRLAWSRDGEPVVETVGYVAGREVTWQLSSGDLLADAGFGDQPSSAGPTRVTVAGQAQQVLDDGDGLVTTETVVETYQVYSVDAPDFRIDDTSGTLVPSGYSDGLGVLQLVQRAVIRRTTKAATLVLEVVETSSWINAEIPTSDMQTGGGLLFRVGTLVESTGGPGRAWSKQIFAVTAREVTEYTYDDEQSLPAPLVAGDGNLVRVVRTRYGWYNPRAALGQIAVDGSITWTNGQDVAWNGDGVSQTVERFIVLERQITDYTVQDGYVTVEREELEGYRVVPGASYLYNGGAASGYSDEQFGLYQVTETTYVATGADSVSRVSTTSIEGAVVETVIESIEGYLPAASRREEVDPDPALYPRGKPASRDQTQAIEATYVSEVLEQFRERRDEEVSSPYIETLDEGRYLAERTVREASAIPVSFALPLNALIRPGQVATVDLSERGQPPVDVWISEVTHRLEPASRGRWRATTSVAGRVYVL